MTDLIVKEVRKHRMEHTARFGGNLASICEDLREAQKSCGHRLVRLPSRKPNARLAQAD